MISIESLSISILIIIISILISFHFYTTKSFNSNSPILIKGLPFFGSLSYFTKRYTFWLESIAQSKTGHFSFRLANLKVVGVSGLEGREAL